MAQSRNRADLLGNLGKDPEIRRTGNGDPVATFSIATTEKWKDKDGEWKDATEWHRIVVWGKLAELAEKYLHKGSKVSLTGKIKTRKWQDKDGTEKYTTEIHVGQGSELIFLDPPQKSDEDIRPKTRYMSKGEAVYDEIPL